jgi:hypothetical protein
VPGIDGAVEIENRGLGFDQQHALGQFAGSAQHPDGIFQIVEQAEHQNDVGRLVPAGRHGLHVLLDEADVAKAIDVLDQIGRVDMALLMLEPDDLPTEGRELDRKEALMA